MIDELRGKEIRMLSWIQRVTQHRLIKQKQVHPTNVMMTDKDFLSQKDQSVDNKQSKRAIAIPMLLVLAGILCFSYPVVSTLWNNHTSKEISDAYDQYSHDQSGDLRKERFQQAKRYNQERNGIFSQDPYQDGKVLENTKEYHQYKGILDEPMGIMGVVKIPKIGVKLPIYHGTSVETLDRGAGHLFGTDMPVGGKNRHTVITAHTGLANSTMFDSLVELKKGDLFYLDVQGELLRYRVFRINVINPQDISLLQREAGRDLATLLTCTPYGVNSHRLLVTGYRVLPDPLKPPEDRMQWPFWMTLFVFAMLFSALILLMMLSALKQKSHNVRGKHIMSMTIGQ